MAYTYTVMARARTHTYSMVMAYIAMARQASCEDREDVAGCLGAYSVHACFDGEREHTREAAARWNPYVTSAAARLYERRTSLDGGFE